MKKRRYSDTNWHLWPFTLSKTDIHKVVGIELNSGANEDHAGDCFFRLFLGRYVLTLELPHIIKDYVERHQAKSWDAATVERVGRDWYDIHYPREYSIIFTGEGAIHTYYGADTHDSSTTKNKVFNLPWRNWRHVRYSLYDKNGKHFWTERDGDKTAWEAKRAVKQALPKVYFQIEDYDGEVMNASTYIDEREWLFGTGLFKWLSWFASPKIRRSLSIEYSSEVGKEKGSWKGGVIGCGIDMSEGETHENAFQRHCEKEHRAKSGKYRIKNLGPLVIPDLIEEGACSAAKQ
jgi:hypothetical protein